MPKRNPIPPGTRFARLVVIGLAEPKYTTQGVRLYCVKTRCDCGTIKDYQELWLRHELVKSCGCLNKELRDARRFKHGHTSYAGVSQTYGIWGSMIQRCTNPKSIGFKNYGSRGITVCERWKTFLNFLTDMGEKPPGLTLERINNNKGYYKDNCRWATRAEQMANRRGNVMVKFMGITGCLEQVCKRFHIKSKNVRYRLQKGWSIEEAMLLPLHTKHSQRIRTKP